MLASVRTLNGMLALTNMIKEQCSYSVSRFLVNEGGFCIHPRVHMLLDEFSVVRNLSTPFVDRVYNLRCPCDVPGGNFSCRLLVGMYFSLFALDFLHVPPYVWCNELSCFLLQISVASWQMIRRLI